MLCCPHQRYHLALGYKYTHVLIIWMYYVQLHKLCMNNIHVYVHVGTPCLLMNVKVCTLNTPMHKMHLEHAHMNDQSTLYWEAGFEVASFTIVAKMEPLDLSQLAHTCGHNDCKNSESQWPRSTITINVHCSMDMTWSTKSHGQCDTSSAWCWQWTRCMCAGADN